ncbi:winged helix-turn-helix transcriptional regulator [Halomicroarcula sp. GCM10025709]|uniref:winged helix-turn-helix transcriptional regulator n=1 Tax=Haloarcula TaxID=2237 RepID=UPI0024C2C274|nr:helix-turn-helix domain-containing protein [Halomicroarcula sp. YJ-61-S]
MSSVRERVRDHVHANPGVHFNQLARDLDIATGQAQYHLRKLRRSGDVTAEEIRGRSHYFDDGYDAWERRVLGLYRRETAREIIVTLLEDGPLSAGTLTDRLGVARSTISWQVSSLRDAGIVEQQYGERGRAVVSLTRPDETQRLLQEVTPSLSDRLVDRFTRLVDASLAGSEEQR